MGRSPCTECRRRGFAAEECQGWSDGGDKEGGGRNNSKEKKANDSRVSSTIGAMVDTFSSLLVYSIARLGLKSERTGDGAPSPIIGTKAPMPSHQIYSVLPLDLNSETIRVVEVLPGNDPDIISCKLHLRKLQETSPYTALSYSWGEKNTPTKEVVINGEMVRVGINLWDWLRQAREHGNCELFWIDAICIDQGSVTEKNNQLPVMTDIYSKV